MLYVMLTHFTIKEIREMKHLFRLCAGVVLTLMLALPAFAGHIPCGLTDPPPEGRTTPDIVENVDTGASDSGAVDAITMLLQNMLSVF